MFGHRGLDCMVVLRIKVLPQSAESRVPTKCVSGELKQTAILKRCGRDKGWSCYLVYSN